jgi:hypothetical protein
VVDFDIIFAWGFACGADLLGAVTVCEAGVFGVSTYHDIVLRVGRKYAILFGVSQILLGMEINFVFFFRMIDKWS